MPISKSTEKILRKKKKKKPFSIHGKSAFNVLVNMNYSNSR